MTSSCRCVSGTSQAENLISPFSIFSWCDGDFSQVAIRVLFCWGELVHQEKMRKSFQGTKAPPEWQETPTHCASPRRSTRGMWSCFHAGTKLRRGRSAEDLRKMEMLQRGRHRLAAGISKKGPNSDKPGSGGIGAQCLVLFELRSPPWCSSPCCHLDAGARPMIELLHGAEWELSTSKDPVLILMRAPGLLLMEEILHHLGCKHPVNNEINWW